MLALAPLEANNALLGLGDLDLDLFFPLPEDDGVGGDQHTDDVTGDNDAGGDGSGTAFGNANSSASGRHSDLLQETKHSRSIHDHDDIEHVQGGLQQICIRRVFPIGKGS